MLGLFRRAGKLGSTGSVGMGVLVNVSSPTREDPIDFGPFNADTPRRWKKPVDSAQTRLENRTRDLRLDKLMTQLKKMKLVLGLQEVISTRKGRYASVQLLSKRRRAIGLNVRMGEFLRKYPHVFEMFTHRVRRNLCCRMTKKMVDLIEEEGKVTREGELAAVRRLKRLLMMSKNGSLHVHALWLIRKELGLPDDFRHSILPRYSADFNLVSPEIVSAASRDELFRAEVEKWREEEHRERWLSEFETRYAFPVRFPAGFKFEGGFKGKLRNWQRLQYVKPYEATGAARVRSCGGVARFEKRAVGLIHELLSLTVEKMMEVERLSHFRRDLGMEVNVRELLLQHPGIFYVSTKGSARTVFLREAYSSGGCLVEPDPIHAVRRQMLNLVLMGRRNTGLLLDPPGMLEKQSELPIHEEPVGGPCEGKWVLPILETLDEQPADCGESGGSSLSAGENGGWTSLEESTMLH